MQVNITNKLLINKNTSSVIYIDSNNIESSVKITHPESNIIIFLNENRGKMISKNQLVDIGWNGRVIGDNSLNVAIYNLRKHLSLDERIQLENIPKLGYKLNIIEPTASEVKNTSNKAETWIEKLSERLPVNAIKIKMLLLIILNIFFLEFILSTYLNLVWIECKNNSKGKICHSKSYSKNNNPININQGISVISKHNHSNNKI